MDTYKEYKKKGFRKISKIIGYKTETVVKKMSRSRKAWIKQIEEVYTNRKNSERNEEYKTKSDALKRKTHAKKSELIN